MVYLGVPGYSMVWWERFYTNVYIGWPRCLGSVVRCLPTLPTGGIPLSSIIGFELFCIMLCVWILLCNIWFPESVSWLELDGTAWTWQTVLHSRAFFCHNGPFLSYGPNLYTHFAISHFLYVAVLINPLWVSVPIFVAFYPWGGVFRPSGCEHT